MAKAKSKAGKAPAPKPETKKTVVQRWPREIWPASELKPAAYNPRKITQHALTGLQNSLLAFGDLQQIVVNRRTGNIIGGHQRYDALVALGETELEVIVADMDEQTEMAANISLNNKAIQGDWDDDKLDELLATLQASPDFDVSMAQDTRLDELIAQYSSVDIELSLELPDENPKGGASKVTASDLNDDNLGESLVDPVETEGQAEHRCPNCNYEWSGKAR